MNWDALGALGEVIGAVAVLVTLVFLTIQLRQNTRSVHSATRARITETMSNTLATLQTPGFSKLLARGAGSDYMSLNAIEELEFRSYCFRLFRVLEDGWFQREHGEYDVEGWESNRNYLLDMLQYPGFRWFFESRKDWFDARFFNYVQSELKDYVPTSELSYIDKLSKSE